MQRGLQETGNNSLIYMFWGLALSGNYTSWQLRALAALSLDTSYVLLCITIHSDNLGRCHSLQQKSGYFAFLSPPSAGGTGRLIHDAQSA